MKPNTDDDVYRLTEQEERQWIFHYALAIQYTTSPTREKLSALQKIMQPKIPLNEALKIAKQQLENDKEFGAQVYTLSELVDMTRVNVLVYDNDQVAEWLKTLD